MQSSQVQQLGLKIQTTSAELEQAEENGDNVRIVRLKTKIAELKLEYKIEEAELELKLKQAEENGDNVRIIRLKTKIAELKLEYKIEEAELKLENKIEEAELKLEQAEEMGARDPVRIVRLKTKIAELKLEQEEKRPTIYTETVNRLKDELANLKQELDRLTAKENVGASEHDKGA